VPRGTENNARKAWPKHLSQRAEANTCRCTTAGTNDGCTRKLHRIVSGRFSDVWPFVVGLARVGLLILTHPNLANEVTEVGLKESGGEMIY